MSKIQIKCYYNAVKFNMRLHAAQTYCVVKAQLYNKIVTGLC